MAASRGSSCLPLPRPLLYTIILLQTSVTSLQSLSQGVDSNLTIEDLGVVYRIVGDETCKMCIWEDNCIDIDKDVCDYYAEAEQILKDDGFQQLPHAQLIPSPGFRPLEFRAEVDSMMYDLVDSVDSYHRDQQCIPFLSKYTNCNKDNICLGCKSCECDSDGQWNCTVHQVCTPDTLRIILDHRSLLTILDNLNKDNINTNRVKRSIEDISNEDNEQMVPLDLDDYSDDHIIDINEGDTNRKVNELTTERYKKMILLDPLYAMSDVNSEFDGNSNKIKRSVEIARTHTLGNTINTDGDFKNKITEDKEITKENYNPTNKFDSVEKYISGVPEINKYNEETTGFSESEFNKKILKDKPALESLQNQENYNDTISSSEISENISTIHELVINVFQKPKNKIMLPFLKLKLADGQNKSLTDNDDILSELINPVTRNEMQPDEIKGDKNKRSTSYSQNSNDKIYDENIKFNPSYLKYNFDEKRGGNVNNLSKQGIAEWLKEQSVLHKKHSNKNLETASIRNTVKLHKTVTNKRLNHQYPIILTANMLTSTINNVDKTRKYDHINNKDSFNLSKQDIAEWLNDQHPVNQVNFNNTQDFPTIAVKTITIRSINDTIIDLKDVDTGIFNSNKTNLRRKSPLDMMSVEKIYPNIVYDNDYAFNEDEFTEEKKYSFTGFENENDRWVTTEATTEYSATTEAVETAVTEVFIDLLESTKTKLKTQGYNEAFDLQKIHGGYDTMEIKNTIYDENLLSAVNIMKRDVLQINQDHDEVTNVFNNSNAILKTEQLPYVKHTEIDLIRNVLLPLNSILNDKRKELEELIKMKDSLIHNIKLSNNHNETFKLTLNHTKEYKDRSSYFSVHKIKIFPNLDPDFKKPNLNKLDLYMTRLKYDIYRVLKDIVGIQKLHTDASKVPKDIKLLTHAMKQYVHTKGFHIKQKNKSGSAMRRYMQNSRNLVDSFSTNNKIMKIIELIDKNVFQENILAFISPVTAKVIKRIIQTYYTDTFAMTGLRDPEPHNNLTYDLNSIGSKWKEMCKKLDIDTPTSKLYKMKSLYQLLSSDIHKINDALHFINFARTTEIMPIDKQVGDTIITRINKDLDKFFLRIATIKQEEKDKELQKLTHPQYTNSKPKQKKQKETILKQFKKLLVNSKKNIVTLLHKKVRKPEIFHNQTKKSLDTDVQKKLSQYKDTIHRWQRQINLTSLRKKRSARTDFNFKSRMKNILPKYLRGKVQGRNNNTQTSATNNKAHSVKDNTRKYVTTTKSSEIGSKKTGKKLANPEDSTKKPNIVNKKKNPSATSKIINSASNKIKNVFHSKRGVRTQSLSKSIPKLKN